MLTKLLRPDERACPLGEGAREACALAGHCLLPNHQTQPSHDAGTVHQHRVVRSDHLKVAPRFDVYLPPGYACDEERRYPNVILLDGQNLLDPSRGVYWGFKELLDTQISTGHIEPVIVTGVHSARRVWDYTHASMNGHGGEGTKHDACLVHEIKPFVDETYRTLSERAQTAIGGFSLGALASLYTALITHPETFSAVIAFSPTLRWANGAIFEALANISKSDTRIFIGMGEYEVNLDEAHRLFELLKSKGWSIPDQLLFFQHERHEHGEAAWRELMRDQVLMALLGFAREQTLTTAQDKSAVV